MLFRQYLASPASNGEEKEDVSRSSVGTFSQMIAANSSSVPIKSIFKENNGSI